MTDRCDYSDLPTSQCAHCTGHTLGDTPLTWPATTSHLTPMATHRPATRPARRRLPVLNSASTYGEQPDLHDMIDELTRDHTARTPHVVQRGTESWTVQHTTDVPALVHQLIGATPAGSKDEAGSSAAKSKPAARIEALDTVMLIDDEAARWIRHLGEDDPGDTIDRATGHTRTGSGTVACIRRLHALHAGLNACTRRTGERDDNGAWCCTPHHLEHDVRRWWHQARVITGWDSPAYRPFCTCPVCEQRGTLRINLALRAGFCTECRSTWGSEDIGVLAEHIRWESGSDDQADPEAS